MTIQKKKATKKASTKKPQPQAAQKEAAEAAPTKPQMFGIALTVDGGLSGADIDKLPTFGSTTIDVADAQTIATDLLETAAQNMRNDQDAANLACIAKGRAGVSVLQLLGAPLAIIRDGFGIKEEEDKTAGARTEVIRKLLSDKVGRNLSVDTVENYAKLGAVLVVAVKEGYAQTIDEASMVCATPEAAKTLTRGLKSPLKVAKNGLQLESRKDGATARPWLARQLLLGDSNIETELGGRFVRMAGERGKGLSEDKAAKAANPKAAPQKKPIGEQRDQIIARIERDLETLAALLKAQPEAAKLLTNAKETIAEKIATILK